jgi:hypothetical protein
MTAGVTTATGEDLGLSQSKRTFEDLRLRHARLMGERDSLLRRKEELTLKVAQAKGRLELEEEVTAVFEALQEKAHRRSIGPYEEGLSACIRDVFPEKGGEGGAANGIVKLELGQHLGMPALDLYINNDGFHEDILTANGGSINNVVVAGLRVSALAQTTNRRLLVLDEPDIWIKPERVPNFVKMLSEVAVKSKTQMLMISHHVPEYFEGFASITKLYSDNGQTKATVLEPRMAEWEDDETPGVRYMRLINVRAHRDTTIPFKPGLNSFIGDNDLGKSTALITGFRAMAYNDANDTLFSHDRSENKDEILEAKIIVGLEKGKRIEYIRQLKKSPKVLYRIYEAGNDEPVFEGRAPAQGKVPEKVEELLGIKRVDGLDIQLRSQKSPIFLLDEPPSTRAKLLSVGRESGHFVSVNEAYRKLKTADSRTRSEGEAELTRINAKLPILDRLVPLQALLAIHSKLNQEIENADSTSRSLARAINNISTARQTMDLCKKKIAVLSDLPKAPPTIEDNTRLVEMLTRLTRLQPRAALELKPLSLKVPTVEDLSRLRSLTDRLEVLGKKASVEVKALTIKVPLVEDLSRLQGAADRLEKLAKKASVEVPPFTLKLPVLEDLSRLETTFTRLGTLERRAKLVLPPLSIRVPEFDDGSRLVEVGKRLGGLQKRVEVLSRLRPLSLRVPELSNNESLGRHVVSLEKLNDAQSRLQVEFVSVEKQKSEVEAANAALKDKIGNFCPLCEGQLPEGALVHEH